MVYELRIYHIHPGRMDAIHRRFADVTLRLFEKHGMRVCDFWEDAEEHPRLYYVLEHSDVEAGRRNFDAFAADPEWIDAKRRSEVDGPIVEKVERFYMRRTPYAPAK